MFRKKDVVGLASSSFSKSLTVLLPTLNEEEALGHLINDLLEVFDIFPTEFIVVDGYSTDQTVELAKAHGFRVVMQGGKGKAGAIESGIKAASGDWILVMDSDYTYDPKDVTRFFDKAMEFDEVIGYRNGVNISRVHRIGNWILTKAFNLTFGTNIPDVACGMYLLKASKAKSLSFQTHGFVIDQEILAQMLPRVGFVPIHYRKRIGKPKTTTWRQGFRALWTILDLARKYNPVFLFSTVASLSIIPALGLLSLGAWDYFFLNSYHSGYFFGAILFLVLGSQGISVATIASLLKRIESRVMVN